MIIRRAAVVLAGIAAAAFMTAGAASATSASSASALGDGGWIAGKGSLSAHEDYKNLGGPYGITYAHGSLRASEAFFGAF